MTGKRNDVLLQECESGNKRNESKFVELIIDQASDLKKSETEWEEQGLLDSIQNPLFFYPWD